MAKTDAERRKRKLNTKQTELVLIVWRCAVLVHDERPAL